MEREAVVGDIEMTMIISFITKVTLDTIQQMKAYGIYGSKI